MTCPALDCSGIFDWNVQVTIGKTGEKVQGIKNVWLVTLKMVITMVE